MDMSQRKSGAPLNPVGESRDWRWQLARDPLRGSSTRTRRLSATWRAISSDGRAGIRRSPTPARRRWQPHRRDPRRPAPGRLLGEARPRICHEVPGNSVAADHPRPAWRRSGRRRIRPPAPTSWLTAWLRRADSGVGPVRDRRTAAVGRDPLSERKPAAGAHRVRLARGSARPGGHRLGGASHHRRGDGTVARERNVRSRVRLRREREGTLRLGRSQSPPRSGAHSPTKALTPRESGDRNRGRLPAAAIRP